MKLLYDYQFGHKNPVTLQRKKELVYYSSRLLGNILLHYVITVSQILTVKSCSSLLPVDVSVLVLQWFFFFPSKIEKTFYSDCTWIKICAQGWTRVQSQGWRSRRCLSCNQWLLLKQLALIWLQQLFLSELYKLFSSDKCKEVQRTAPCHWTNFTLFLSSFAMKHRIMLDKI